MSNISTYKAKIYKGSLPEQGLEYWTKQDWKEGLKLKTQIYEYVICTINNITCIV